MYRYQGKRAIAKTSTPLQGSCSAAGIVGRQLKNKFRFVAG
jgi:hypothetical protein